MRAHRWGSGDGAMPAYPAYQAGEPVNETGGESLRLRLAQRLARRARARLMSAGHSRRRMRWLLGFMFTLVTLAGLVGMALPGMRFAHAAPTIYAIPASSSCAALAHQDSTATNGSSWGRTILPGHNAPGGWFGVDVCSNGINFVAPNGSNVSCDRVPDNWSHKGCAPGRPTDDGYGWSFQCVELVVRFSAWAFGDNPGGWNGNAPDIWLPANHPRDFVMYPNGSSVAPVPGDILVWGWVDAQGRPVPAGPDDEHGGHIAVVAGVHHGELATAEQNVKWGAADHPTDQLALTHVGSRWIVSGSSSPQKILPTYRWQRTMGLSRATYGWLHSVKNDGVFPSHSRGASPTAPTAIPAPAAHPAQTPSTQASGGFPSLTPAVVAADSGALSDLVWSNNDFFTPRTSDAQPEARSRSLGAPPGAQLSPGQRVASVEMTSGARYTYALGADGNLYAAHTAPNTLGVYWANLGAPAGVRLHGMASASLFAGGVVLAALGSNGQLWARFGPPDTLGAWQAIGKPSQTTFGGAFAVTAAPGAGTPLAFALGADGLLYESVWHDATLATDGSVELPAGWGDWTRLAPHSAGQAQFVSSSGALLALEETPSAHNWIGSWPDAPLDVLLLDTHGALWQLRNTNVSSGWTAQQIAFTAPTGAKTTPQLAALLAGVVVAGDAANGVTSTTTPAASSTASNTSTSATPSASVVQVYAATSGATWLVALPPVDTPSSQQAKTPAAPQWTKLPATPGLVAAHASGSAVSLAPGLSALVFADGDALYVGGVANALALLLPNQSATSAPATNTSGWRQIGVSWAPLTFNDSFSGQARDSRWQMTDASARVTTSANGLTLTPNRQGIAALLQAGQPAPGALTVHLTLPQHVMANGASAGLVLYLDDGDWLTLLVGQGGEVQLCAMAWQQPTYCARQKLTVAAGGQVYLRLTRTPTLPATFAATASGDGQTWATIGAWAPSWPGPVKAGPAASATTSPASHTSTPTATPTNGAPGSTDGAVAPLAFTSWGILAVGPTSGASDARSPTFTGFSYTPLQ
ncbi:MAG: CHAP domain-containing protein [Ktedonobacterales bacterium]